MVFSYNEHCMFEAYIDHVRVVTDSPENRNVKKLSDLQTLKTQALLYAYTTLSYLHFKYKIDEINEYRYINSFKLELISIHDNIMTFLFSSSLYNGKRLSIISENNEFVQCELIG